VHNTVALFGRFSSFMPRSVKIALFGLCAAVFPGAAFASFLPPELMDTAADWLALFVLFIVPIGGIVLFWLVHILPEKIAEKRHHPQKSAINTLCLLSLVFGGLLWPIAWLWAYTRPVGYKLAYGTDKHDDYYREMAHEARAGKLARTDIARIKSELDDIEVSKKLSAELRAVRDEFDAILSGAAPASAKGSGS
jgi:CBS domain containing-hemolysin-like protein